MPDLSEVINNAASTTKGEGELVVTELDARKKATDTLRNSGLVFPAQYKVAADFQDKDGNLLSVEDASTLADKDLGKYLTVYTALCAYAEVIVAAADIDWTDAMRVAAFYENNHILKLPKRDFPNVADRKASADVDPVIKKFKDKEFLAYATLKLATGLLKAYQQQSNLISREISRRSNLEYGERHSGK